ncbi:7253_t:CDS:1, partial [Cetraspora pellucida]
ILDGFRPEGIEKTLQDYTALMNQCWDAIPENRPEAQIVFRKLIKLVKKMHENFDKETSELTNTTNSANLLNSKLSLPTFHTSEEHTETIYSSHIQQIINFSEPTNATK